MLSLFASAASAAGACFFASIAGAMVSWGDREESSIDLSSVSDFVI
jgi:hypothetical protein